VILLLTLKEANASVVGSILTSVEEGQHVNRADELGYFAFGKHLP
jgi:phosphatidylserine decarboxylase